jgi:ABC-2 type transport system permease protein
MEVMYILWLRQLRRYWRSRSRVLGAFGQPILLLLALGYGLGSVYKRAGQGDYLQFLVPGIIVQTVLLSGMFWGAIILMDKRFGFLSELLVAPVSRVKILVGSAIGGATTCFLQGCLVLILATLLGFRPHDWLGIAIAFGMLAVMTVALACFGAGIASMIEDFQGFQGIMNFLVFPLFFLSSALYPLTTAPGWLRFIGNINPISYMVDALRQTMTGQKHFGLEKDLIVITITLVIAVAFAVNRFNRVEV